MPTPEHGVAGHALGDQLRLELVSMGHGLSDAIKSSSGASVCKDGTGKYANTAFGPRRRARGDQANAIKRRYTVTVEVGISETKTSLKRDVDYWLNPDCGNVNMVITIKASREVAEINIQTWKMVNERPHCEQSVFITKNKKGTVRVTEPLYISFRALFDREQTIPAEKDIVLSKERLQSIAEDIWEDQEI
ncbi:hypothetical protein N7467_000894 [Penicillium canescens]|nr:hypothetical protein N7467_000894 [Penicillium canescens]